MRRTTRKVPDALRATAWHRKEVSDANMKHLIGRWDARLCMVHPVCVIGKSAHALIGSPPSTMWFGIQSMLLKRSAEAFRESRTTHMSSRARSTGSAESSFLPERLRVMMLKRCQVLVCQESLIATRMKQRNRFDELRDKSCKTQLLSACHERNATARQWNRIVATA